MNFIFALMAAGLAFLARWAQMHPEKLISPGMFIGQDTFGARLFRAQVVVIGTAVVFVGVFGASESILSLVTFGSGALSWLAMLVSAVAGVVAAVYVRREVKAQPPYQSSTSHGWWP